MKSIIAVLIVTALLYVCTSNTPPNYTKKITRRPDIEEIFPPPSQYYKNIRGYEDSYKEELIPFHEYR